MRPLDQNWGIEGFGLFFLSDLFSFVMFVSVLATHLLFSSERTEITES